MPNVNLARERSFYNAYADRALSTRQHEIARLQEQISSGRRINRPSDDPTAYAQARKTETLSKRYEQYGYTIDSSRTWVDHTQQALDHLTEQFARAYESGVRMGNDTQGAAVRQDEADRMRDLRDDIIATLNTRVGDEYLFAGTSSTQQPFDGATGLPTAGSGDYTGVDGGRKRQIGPGQALNINITGQDAHVYRYDTSTTPPTPRTIVDALDDLILGLDNNDAKAIHAATAEVSEARDHLLERGSEAGNIANRLDAAGAQLRESQLRLEQRRSELEDADMATVLSEFQQAQAGLQAALKTTASIMQTTLLDYL